MTKEDRIILLERFKNGLLACATNGSFDMQEYEKMRAQILEIEYLKSNMPIFLKVQRTPDEFRRYMQELYSNYAGRRSFITEEINKLILLVEEEGRESELVINDIDSLGEFLGYGGFGHVYKHHNELLDLDFAIKVFDPLFSSEEEKSISEKRFFREAKMLFTLQHPNIVRVYDVGRLQGKPFIKMELVEGYNMNDLLKKYSHLTFNDSLVPIIELLKGLEYAHFKGIIHRDLKPSNYMYSETCGYKIIDFGISAFLETEEYTKLTKTGEQIAGGLYTDPQLMENSKLRDFRSDIYSVGAIWHFLLTGRAPSGGDMRKNLIEIYNIDENETDLIMKCLAYELEDRYSNCLELREILERMRQEILV